MSVSVKIKNTRNRYEAYRYTCDSPLRPSPSLNDSLAQLASVLGGCLAEKLEEEVKSPESKKRD